MNKPPRYPDLQNATWCAHSVIINRPIRIYMFNSLMSARGYRLRGRLISHA